MKRSCSACDFYDAASSECRYFSPYMAKETILFPTLPPDSWCRRFEARPVEPAPVAPPSAGGRPVRHQFKNFEPVFREAGEDGLTFGELFREAQKCAPISKSTLFDALQRWREEGHVESIDLPGQPPRYRMASAAVEEAP